VPQLWGVDGQEGSCFFSTTETRRTRRFHFGEILGALCAFAVEGVTHFTAKAPRTQRKRQGDLFAATRLSALRGRVAVEKGLLEEAIRRWQNEPSSGELRRRALWTAKVVSLVP